MSIVIRIEDSQGSISWILPDKLAKKIEEFGNEMGEQARKEVTDELTSFVRRFTSLLCGTMLFPPTINRNLNLISNFLNTLAKLSLEEANAYKDQMK